MDQACLSHEEKTQVSFVWETGGRTSIAGCLLSKKKERRYTGHCLSCIFYRRGELIFLLCEMWIMVRGLQMCWGKTPHHGRGLQKGGTNIILITNDLTHRILLGPFQSKVAKNQFWHMYKTELYTPTWKGSRKQASVVNLQVFKNHIFPCFFCIPAGHCLKHIFSHWRQNISAKPRTMLIAGVLDPWLKTQGSPPPQAMSKHSERLAASVGQLPNSLPLIQFLGRVSDTTGSPTILPQSENRVLLLVASRESC